MGFGSAFNSAMSPVTGAGGHLASGLGKLGGLFGRRGSDQPGVDAEGNIAGQAGQASGFANIGEQGYHRLGGEANAVRSQLRRQASGEESLSAEQLRQGLQQNLAAQRSMAASAAPGSQVMAARTAAMQAGRLGSGMAGQQAMAGIAERQAANQALGAMLMQQRQQDLQAALGARGQAIGGYGAIEQARTSRYGADMGTPSTGEMILGGIQGGAGLFGAR